MLKLKDTAKEGGDIAKNTRKELEHKIGKLIISSENYWYLEEKKKRKLLMIRNRYFTNYPTGF
ncbi:hypothetical protein HYX11_04105 [Candidatus Woesearchaeota archaeon]|nr:hypothetical protein [Candidatus Woesearchaeota archaeon]